MDFSHDLNDRQLEAVTTDFQYARVIAGAGSGKTRVLTYRIAYLISEMGVKPWTILAITFTNKVANEMKERLASLVPFESAALNIRTFHSFAAFFLRQEISVLGFPATFSIMDEEDQTKLVKDIAVEFGYKRGDQIVSKALSFIAASKLREQYPEDISVAHEAFEGHKTCLEIYQRYEDEKDKMFALDFDDLLLYSNSILANYPMVRAKWQNKIGHILVDEFQDTNDVEYKFLRYLLKPISELYVVGDPDQTIYTWRGANQKIIMDLDKDFKGVTTISLEQNYRSTQTILDSANKLIAHNRLRIPKNLFTVKKGGEPIVVHGSFSPKEEGRWVASEIRRLKEIDGYSYSDIAILYRSNYVTVDFESGLTGLQIPYRIYGGQKFYQRREVKDVLAYFRLIVNTKDDMAFERAAGVPKRGIGETSMNALKAEAAANGLSLYDCVSEAGEDSQIPSKVLKALKPVVKRIDIARADIGKGEEVFSKTLEDMVSEVGIYDALSKEEDGDDRLENVKALFQDLRSYLHSNPQSTFDEYLQNIALISSQDEFVDGDFVTLMTAHTAKGLEFPIVFVVRLNQGIFPHNRALAEGGYTAMEEERRLAYVAYTRAKERLFLSFSSGYSYVLQTNLGPSVFIKESGNAVPNPDQMASQYGGTKIKSFHFGDQSHSQFDFDQEPPKRKEKIKQDFSSSTNGIDDWKVGDLVFHKNLGSGVVVALDGDGIIEVDFDEHGIKSIMGNHPFVTKGGKA